MLSTSRTPWGSRPLMSRLVLIALALGLLLVPAAGTATTATPQPSAPPFGVRAGLYGLTTLPGEHFNYSLKAGAHIDDTAVLYNQSKQPLTFTIYAADVANTAGGGLAPAQRSDEMNEVGAWLKLKTPAKVTLQPGSQQTTKFTLTVPVGTPPGSYLGAVVTSLRTPAANGGLGTETRVARLIELTVLGKAKLGLELTTLKTKRVGSHQEFTITVKNTGNVLFTVDGSFRVTGGSTHEIPLSPKGIYVVPDGSATFTGRLNHLPMIGKRTITAEVAATVPRGDSKTFHSNTVKLSFFPWLVALIVLAVVVLLAATLYLTRRWWQARLRRFRTERAAFRQMRREMRANPTPEGEPADEVTGED